MIIIRFQKRISGSQTCRPVPEPDKILDQDRTCIETKYANMYHTFDNIMTHAQAPVAHVAKLEMKVAGCLSFDSFHAWK